MATSDEVGAWRAALQAMGREWAETVQAAAERRFERARDASAAGRLGYAGCGRLGIAQKFWVAFAGDGDRAVGERSS